MLTISRPHVPDTHRFREYVSRWKSPLWSRALYRLVGPVYRDRTAGDEPANDKLYLEGSIWNTNYGRKRVNYCHHIKFDGEFVVSVKSVKSGFRGFFTDANGLLSYEGSKDWRTQVVTESADDYLEEDNVELDDNRNKYWAKYRSTRGTCTREQVNVYNQIVHDYIDGHLTTHYETDGPGKTVYHDQFESARFVGIVDKLRVYYTRTTKYWPPAHERRISPAGFPQYGKCTTTVQHLYEDIDVWQTLDLQGSDCFANLWEVRNAISLFGGNLFRKVNKTYTEQIAVEAYDAACKYLSSNNIENAVQLRDTISSVWKLPLSLLRKAKQFAKLVRTMKGFNLNSLFDAGWTVAQIASELHLWWRYVFKPTKKDFLELLEYSKTQIKHTRCLNGQWTRAQASDSKPITVDGVQLEVERRFSCYLRSNYPGGTPLARMRAYGADLSLANLWDLVPFSFCVDWFIEVGPWLQTIESFYAYALFDFKDRCYSAKCETDLDRVASLTQYGRGGRVKVYVRDPLLTVQFPSLPEIAHGKSYKLTAMALLVSNS